MDNEKRETWLADLKAGDTVVILTGGYGSHPIKRVVDKVTPSGLIRVGHYTFNPEGRERGSSYSRADLLPATQENLDRADRSSLVSQLSAVRWEAKTLTLDTLRQIVALLTKKER